MHKVIDGFISPPLLWQGGSNSGFRETLVFVNHIRVKSDLYRIIASSQIIRLQLKNQWKLFVIEASNILEK